MTFATALLVYLLLRFWACLSQSITPPRVRFFPKGLKNR